MVLTANGSGRALDAFKQCMVDPPCGQRREVVPGRCRVVLVFRPCIASLARGCSSLASVVARLRQEFPLRSLSVKEGKQEGWLCSTSNSSSYTMYVLCICIGT